MTVDGFVSTDKAPAAIGPYSQGIIAKDMLFVSGQLGIDPQTLKFAGEDFDAQARQALKNLGHIVSAGGFELSHIVAVDVFLTDMNNFKAFNEIYADFFPPHQPARAVVEVSALPMFGLIEIKCIARK
jgi:2-iminobutanoate/2-iminopropanoate deaminase